VGEARLTFTRSVRRNLWRARATLQRWARPSSTSALKLVRGTPVEHWRRSLRLRRQDVHAARLLADTASTHVGRRNQSAERMPVQASAGVTVVCVTNRPSRLSEALANYQRQNYQHKTLLLVTNSVAFDPATVRAQVANLERATVLHVDERATLGECLNLAIERTSTQYLAKFDDDDWYGGEYLSDMMLAHRLADAGIVGKKSYFAWLEELSLCVLRFPGHEYMYTSHVSGGTFVIDLSRTGRTRFPALSIGEDTAFLEAWQREGGSIFSADRFNYLQVRGAHNTWRVPAKELARSGMVLDRKSEAGTVDL
jgi:hypothetical protein